MANYRKMAKDEVELALALGCFSPDVIAGTILFHALKLGNELVRDAGLGRDKAAEAARLYYHEGISILSRSIPRTTLVTVQQPGGVGFKLDAFDSSRLFSIV